MRVILPIIAGFLILFVGIYLSGQLALYEEFPYLDSLMHLLGGATIAWLIIAYANSKRPSFRRVIIITLIVGLLWELAEYLSGINLQGTVIYKYFHGGNRLDTLADLFMDGLGAAGVLILPSKRSHPFESLDTKQP